MLLLASRHTNNLAVSRRHESLERIARRRRDDHVRFSRQATIIIDALLARITSKERERTRCSYFPDDDSDRDSDSDSDEADEK